MPSPAELRTIQYLIYPAGHWEAAEDEALDLFPDR
jgi:hypothetical protein